MTNEFVLNPGSAIGDAIIASALQKPLNEKGFTTGLVSKGFILPLWKGLENTETYESLEDLPEGAQLIDLSHYLRHKKGIRGDPLPNTTRTGHLAEWMAYEALSQNLNLVDEQQLDLVVSRDDVRVVLTKEEVQAGANAIQKIRKIYGGKPVVALAPFSSTKNKNLPTSTLETVAKGLEGHAVTFLRFMDGKGRNVIDGVHYFDTGAEGLDMRTGGPALFLAADAGVYVDSAPLHMLAGAVQGTQDYEIEGVNHALDKAVLTVGSSHPEVVGYNGNRVVQSDGNCFVEPCAAHGYESLDGYTRLLKVKMHPTADPEKDKSGCYNSKYSSLETAPCMESINPDQIVEEVRAALRA